MKYEDAFKLFSELLNKDMPMDKIVQLLNDIDASFILPFLTQFAENLKESNKLNDFNDCFLTNKYKDVTRMATRFFAVVGFYSQWQKESSLSGTFFCNCLNKINQKSTFSIKVCDIFYRYVINVNAKKSYAFLNFDYSNTDDKNLNLMGLFIEKLAENEILDLSSKKVKKWANRYEVRSLIKACMTAKEQQSTCSEDENKLSDTVTPEEITEAKTIPVPVSKDTSVVITPDSNQAVELSKSVIPIIDNVKESEDVKEPVLNQNLNYTAIVTEIQEAHKSLLETVSLAENSMGQMSESLSDSLGTIDFLKQENKSNEEKITQLKKEQSSLESEKRDFEDKLRTSSQQLAKTNTEVESLKKEIARLESELNTERQEKLALEDSEENKISQIEEQAERIIDLEQRLKKSLEQDAIAENQELITLKKELSRQLQDAFKDSMEYARQDYSADLLESYQFLLNKIFKMFKRHGINFEEEG